jgi:hypothetical protein
MAADIAVGQLAAGKGGHGAKQGEQIPLDRSAELGHRGFSQDCVARHAAEDATVPMIFQGVAAV